MQEIFFFRRLINRDKTDRDVSHLGRNMYLQRIQEISDKLLSRESARNVKFKGQTRNIRTIPSFRPFEGAAFTMKQWRVVRYQ